MSNSGYISAAVRNAVSKRDRGICQHCGRRATRAEVSKRGVLQYWDDVGRVYHLDHRVPTSQGGESTPENLLLSCAPCNLSKRRAVAANDPEVLAILSEFGPTP